MFSSIFHLIGSHPAHRHVGLAASIHGFCHGVHQVATDAEVTHLHLALRVDQHIGGLHIYHKEREKTDGSI